ncbi:MAG: hypothetical protein ACK5LS_00215 [Propioniciclava sp.]
MVPPCGGSGLADLPPLETAGGIPVPWPAARSGALEADLWWPTLTAHPAVAGEGLGLFHASGRIEPVTLAHLIAEVMEPTSPAPWRHVQDQPGPPRSDHRGPLAGLAQSWVRGFSGRAWSLDTPVAIAAPAYADSVVVSGPAELGDRIKHAGLQGAEVAHANPHRIWSN